MPTQPLLTSKRSNSVTTILLVNGQEVDAFLKIYRRQPS